MHVCRTVIRLCLSTQVPSAPFLEGGINKRVVESSSAEGETVPKLLRARASRNAEEKHKILNLARSLHAPADWIATARISLLSWQGLRTTRIA
jgi:hypothetical protein